MCENVSVCAFKQVSFAQHTHTLPLHNDSEIAKKNHTTTKCNSTKLSRKKEQSMVENSKFKAFFAVDKNANEQIFEIVSFGDSLFTGNKWSNKWKNGTEKKISHTEHSHTNAHPMYPQKRENKQHSSIRMKWSATFTLFERRKKREEDYKLLLRKTCSEDNEMRNNKAERERKW